jgi:hypothetical protein
MRVYLPATLPALAAALEAAEIGPAPMQAFTVTPALREWYAQADLEELEYAALNHAARASLWLLLANPDAPGRRVVLAADVPAEQAGRDGGLGWRYLTIGCVLLRGLNACFFRGRGTTELGAIPLLGPAV